jgi:hypothetical protein
MRKIGHTVETKLLREDHDYYRDELSESTAARTKEKRARNADHFTTHVETAFHVARIGYLFDVPLTEVVQVLRAALPELVVAEELGATFSPIVMREYLGAALLTGEKGLIKWLAELPKESYADPGIEVSEAGYALVLALQAGVGDEKGFRTKVSKFSSSLAPNKLVVSPASEKAIYGPLSLLLQAIVDKDQSAFNKAWRDQEASWKKRFGRPSERGNMDGILDFEGLGLARIAQKRGLQVPDTNPYAPVALLDAGKAL